MANAFQSSKTLEQRFEIIDKVGKELEDKGMPFGKVYLEKLKEFWTSLNALFGEDEALRNQYKEKYPGIKRFDNLKSFEKFYNNAVRSKIEQHLAEEGSEKLKKQFIYLADRLKDEGINFLIPYVEEGFTDGSYVCRTGGIHVDAKFFLPDCTDEKTAIQSRHKHFPNTDYEEFDLEKLCLQALAKLGYKVSAPETFSDTPLVIATKMYAGDLRFLQSLNGAKDEQKEQNRELRKKYAMKIIDELVPIIIHLTASYEGKISVKNDSENDLKELFRHEGYFDKNRKRFGFTTEGLYDIFISELAMTTGTDVKEDKILEELTKEFNRLVYAKLDSFKKFMLHGDMYLGNVLEDTNANLAITDFTPFRGPITFDLFSIIEHLQSTNEARKEILQYAAKKIFENSPRLGITLEAKTEEKYFEQLMHEYQWTSIHRNLNFAGIILKYLRDPENKRVLPPPSIFYSKAIKILDELGKSNPEYHTLASSLDRYVKKKFLKDGKPLLEEREIGEIDFSFLADKGFSLSGPLKQAVGTIFPAEDRVTRGKPEDYDNRVKQVTSIGPHDGDHIPIGIFDDTGLFVRSNASMFREALKVKIEDTGKSYVCTLPLTTEEVIKNLQEKGLDEEAIEKIVKTSKPPYEFRINKLNGDIEYSIRGKELHVINHKENRRYRLDLTDEKSTLTKYESPITSYTDRRTVWDTKELIEKTEGYVTIDTLEDRVLFKKKGWFGNKVVDEILFDTASKKLQLLKYLNDNYERHGQTKIEGKQVTVNGKETFTLDDQVIVLDSKNRTVEGELISVSKMESSAGLTKDKKARFKPAKTPFALRTPEGGLMLYKEVDGISQMTTTGAEKTLYRKKLRDYLSVGTKAAGFGLTGSGLYTGNMTYSIAGLATLLCSSLLDQLGGKR